MDAPTLRRVLADFFKFNPKDFHVDGSPTGYLVNINRTLPATLPFRLQVTKTGDLEVGVRYGEINQEVANTGMVVNNKPLFKWGVSAGDTVVYAAVPCVWDTNWAFWKRTGAPIAIGSASVLPAASSEFAYCLLANLVITDGKITTCSPAVSGDQTWSRLPSPTLFADDFTRR